jgi:hypothetical protein
MKESISLERRLEAMSLKEEISLFRETCSYAEKYCKEEKANDLADLERLIYVLVHEKVEKGAWPSQDKAAAS